MRIQRLILILEPKAKYSFRDTCWRQEWSELLESVIKELKRPDLTEFEREICRDLLGHLAETQRVAALAEPRP
jgi:hypothetical protein